MSDKSQINAKELGEFLLEAKRNTYASGKKAERIGNLAKKFTSADNNYVYTDIYFEDDPNPFIGQEIIYKKAPGLPLHAYSIPIWGMNYYGKMTEEGRKYKFQKGLWNFLKEALKANENIKRPFRGPMSDLSSKFDLAYTNKSKGNILDFKGKETIHVFCEALDETGSLLYQLEYQGGII